MPLLKLDSIVYAYPQREGDLLRGASLELSAGERIGLLGGNGAGKSTLLHIAAGLIAPHKGSVTLCGAPCVSEADFAAARKGLGYLLQNAEDMLFCPTILEDAAFGPYNAGKSSSEARAIAHQALARVGIERLESLNGHRLSGGEKKMAALAALIAMQPRLFLLDEPTNDLDRPARDHMIALLCEMEIASLVASHDLDFMRRLCTRFCLLEDGVIREVPPPA